MVMFCLARARASGAHSRSKVMRSAAATPGKRRRRRSWLRRGFRSVVCCLASSSSPSSCSCSLRCELTLLTVKWLAKGESRLEATPVC